ncbi:MAG: CRISPR-associated helicase Cas3' [Sphaerochaetaceae bacterium]|nr:CRISPR-associated helicase Cas3' [Sphaerochaetaceae bacterium]
MKINNNSSFRIAHVRKMATGEWDMPQLLIDHLEKVAGLSAMFGDSFHSSEWAFNAGLGHDISKSRNEWQTYVMAVSGYGTDAPPMESYQKIEHASSSAKVAEEIFGKAIGRILAYLIAGHHTGLPDWSGSVSSLQYRLQLAKTDSIPSQFRQLLEKRKKSIVVPPFKFAPKDIGFSLWIRMLFSCLVDADYLDTEAYMVPENAAKRNMYLDLEHLKRKFNEYMERLQKETLQKSDTPVNRIRQVVLGDCRSAADQPPGFFSLTVPTGGGKTLSSLAFALGHACRYKKNRIIYVMPYTSIIEQNADVFRTVLGDDQVIEHHCNIEEKNTQEEAIARLAMENWDAPVIVTTTVQFYESLFASKPGACRKLHNIAESVVILDEAQLMPTEYLKPILSCLQSLTEHFGTSVVVCTATQPVLEKQSSFPGFPGLPEGSIREIIKDVPLLYRTLRRVEFDPIDVQSIRTWNDIAEEISSEERVLCIVSDRKSCRELHALMPKGTYHLSALMCPQHRSDVIKRIKEDLHGDMPVRVVSTQLVEAGVDIDFPVVYRSLAGLDSIAQAAGRCNREGLLSQEGKQGRVVVFRGPRNTPSGILRKASETTAGMVMNGLTDPLAPANFQTFFSELYWKANTLDAHQICELSIPDTEECGIQFRSISEAFHLIESSNMKTIFIPYGKGNTLIEHVKRFGLDTRTQRKLQRFSVQIRDAQFQQLLHRGSLVEASVNFFALQCHIEYSDEVGLLIDEINDNPESYLA